MIVTNETDPGHHTVHAGGVAAIIQIDNHPLELVTAVLGGHPLLPRGRQVGHLDPQKDDSNLTFHRQELPLI